MDAFGVLSGFLRDVGFPVFVSVYLLVRVEQTLKQPSRTLDELTQLVRLMETNRHGPHH